MSSSILLAEQMEDWERTGTGKLLPAGDNLAKVRDWIGFRGQEVGEGSLTQKQEMLWTRNRLSPPARGMS